MDLRSFIVNLTAKYRDLCIMTLTNIPLKRLVNEFPVNTDTPSQIQPVRREEGGCSVDGV